MKRALKALKFSADSHPTQADQSRAALYIADLLQRAKAIGHAHASDETAESSAWGGDFTDVLSSAWDIVTNFVNKIAGWIAGQDEADLTEEAIQAEVEALAETVGDTEVASAIEQAVMDELTAQGVDQVTWNASPDACPVCRDNADAGPVSRGSTFPSGDTSPPSHPRCRCSLGVP